MYYPKQVPQLLNKTFQKSLEYQEYYINELQEYIICIWRITSKQTLIKPIINTVLPDACIDLIIDLQNRVAVFSGFSKNTEKISLEGNVNFIGVRFKPGSIHMLYDIPGDQVMDHTLMFDTLESQFDITPVFNAPTIDMQLNIIKRYLMYKIKTSHNTHYTKLVDALYHNPTAQHVSDIALSLGYEKRQLQRVFFKNYGVSPKVLLNILRLHKCLSLLFDDSKTMQNIALECGFYDQAHFIKEIKKYTGISPTVLLEEYKQ